MNKLMQFALCCAATVASATPAFAGVTIFTGTTAGGPTYNRPIARGNNAPTTLSGVGTAVPYAVTAFTVSLSGNYNFSNIADYDTYLGIYANSFAPATPLVNAVAYNDDFGISLDSGFSNLPLLAGVSYFAVSTGFANTDFGAFTLRVDGPGDIVGSGLAAVPEPTTWAMMIIGFGLVGGAMRRRRQRVAVTYA